MEETLDFLQEAWAEGLLDLIAEAAPEAASADLVRRAGRRRPSTCGPPRLRALLTSPRHELFELKEHFRIYDEAVAEAGTRVSRPARDP